MWFSIVFESFFSHQKVCEFKTALMSHDINIVRVEFGGLVLHFVLEEGLFALLQRSILA